MDPSTSSPEPGDTEEHKPTAQENELVNAAIRAGWLAQPGKRQVGTDGQGAYMDAPTPRGVARLRLDRSRQLFVQYYGETVVPFDQAYMTYEQFLAWTAPGTTA